MLYNRDRLLALMDRFDLSGVVAATSENVYYLSGHASWSQNGYRYGGSQVYVVFPRDTAQSPALLIPGGDVGYAALDDVWLKEAYTYGRPRRHHVPDIGKLSPEERRTVEITRGTQGTDPRESARPVNQRQGLGPRADRYGSFWHSANDLRKDRIVSPGSEAATGIEFLSLRADDQDTRRDSAVAGVRRAE